MLPLPGSTVIPSVRHLKDLPAAIEAPSPFVLFTNVHIGNLQVLAAKVKESGKYVLVHSDMIGGFRADRDGVKLLKNMFRVDGILSQNSSVISTAMRAEIWAIQRIFLMDSRSLERGIQILDDTRPDGIEVLPGALAQRFTPKFLQWKGVCNLVAGGFIDDASTTAALFEAGFEAVTASEPTLWK